MNISIDISMYPLHQNFEEPIKAFIRKLRASEFTVIENPLSTQVYGDYHKVMDWIKENVHESFLNKDNCVFVLKLINGDRSNYEPTA